MQERSALLCVTNFLICWICYITETGQDLLNYRIILPLKSNFKVLKLLIYLGIESEVEYCITFKYHQVCTYKLVLKRASTTLSCESILCLKMTLQNQIMQFSYKNHFDTIFLGFQIQYQNWQKNIYFRTILERVYLPHVNPLCLPSLQAVQTIRPGLQLSVSLYKFI